MTEPRNPPEVLTEVVSATTAWDVLGGIGGIAAGASLLLLLYLQAKPRVNRWALVRFLHATYAIEAHDLLTNEQASSLPLKHRLRRWRRRRGFWLYQRLMTMIQRVKAPKLQDAFESARFDMYETWAPDYVDFPEHLTEDERCIALEAAAVSTMREERHRHKQRMRIHKGLRCAGGCGTRFGKRRPDHNFSGGDGIEGGWFCESSRSCRDKPSGDHFCGMCTLERRSAATEDDSEAP